MNWQNVTVKLSDLQPWEHNPRTMTKKQAQRLLKSWKDLGQFQTIAIGPRENGSGCPVYDGHQRLSALLAAYGAQYAIDARQSDRALTEDERRYLITQANLPVGAWRFEEIAGWPEAQEWGFDAEMLQTWNSDAASLATMLEAEQPQGDADAEPQIDRAAELNEKWQVQRGDLWRIGAHRLLCGDSTKREDVERVMGGEKASLVVTDPPYGVSYADKNIFLNAISRANHVETPIENDHGTKEETQAMWKAAFAEMSEVMSPGAVVYCFMPQGGDQMMMMMMMMMMGAGIEPRHELIWLKNNHVLGRVDYAYKHEPILYAWKDGGHKFYGDFQTSILEFPKPQISDSHPTMKPVALIERLISNSSRNTAVIYDPFVGSGTTLIACQNLQRKCRAIEISPNYCAVILERMATAFPGIEIERLEEGSNGAA